jgi:NitT/TauT family transport system substrate-binding protein
MKHSTLFKFFVSFSLLVLASSACNPAPVTPENTEMPEPTVPMASEIATDIPQTATVPETVTLKLGYMSYISNTVFMIAEEEGYFAEQGLDVELLPIKSGNELIPLLLAGELDVSAPSLNAAFFNAVTREGQVKIIMPLTDFQIKDCPTIAYMARKADVDAGRYLDKQEWKNANLVISMQALTSVPGYVLGMTLAPSGLSVDDMLIANVDAPAHEEALRNGQVDIVYAIEPAITRMTAKGDIVVLDSAEQYAPGLASSVIVVGPKVFNDPEVGNRFAIAYLKAVRQYLQGPTPRNVELAAELTSLAPELVERICWSDSSPDGILNLQSVMDYQNWLMERGLLDALVAPEDFYEPAFAEYAVGILGTMDSN